MRRYKWFTLEEFSSPDKLGSGSMMNHKLMQMIDIARDIAGFPFIINSGFRTIEHNRRVGGAPNSSHLLGLAADVHCGGSHKRFLMLEAFLEAGFTRIGVGENFMHIDIDSEKSDELIWTYGKK